MATKKAFANKFRFMEKAVTADVAFEAFGKSLNDIFQNSAMATAETMVDTDTVASRLQKTIKLQNKDIGALLIDFLNEICYYKDAEQMLLCKFEVDIKQNKETKIYVLTAKIGGEHIDYKKHQLRADVKAATHHMFELKQHGKEWTAIVVLDI